MAGIVFLAAMAGGGAALHEAVHEGTGAHVTEGHELIEDAAAAVLEGSDVGDSWHSKYLALPIYVKARASQIQPHERRRNPSPSNSGYLNTMSCTRFPNARDVIARMPLQAEPMVVDEQQRWQLEEIGRS